MIKKLADGSFVWLCRQIPDIVVIGEADNGLDAVEFVDNDQPDVVVMDFRMPFMDGLQATEKITRTWPNDKSHYA